MDMLDEILVLIGSTKRESILLCFSSYKDQKIIMKYLYHYISLNSIRKIVSHTNDKIELDFGNNVLGIYEPIYAKGRSITKMIFYKLSETEKQNYIEHLCPVLFTNIKHVDNKMDTISVYQ